MVFCVKCGFEITIESGSFCPKCRSHKLSRSEEPETDYVSKQSSIVTISKSRWWYLLPIFFSIIGGIIAYFVLRHDDPRLAKNCLVVGGIMFAVGFFVGFFVGL